MVKSLQDQLLSAGLTDKKKQKETQKQQRKEKKKKQKGHNEVDEVKLSVQEARAKKAERDREINQQKNEQAEKKAILAQIKQLIDVNQIRSTAGDINYQFTDDNTIKRIQVDNTLHLQLVNGIIAIARNGKFYALVPKRVAEKIMQRDASFVVVLNKPSEDIADTDDPYADYQVPDDLMW